MTSPPPGDGHLPHRAGWEREHPEQLEQTGELGGDLARGGGSGDCRFGGAGKCGLNKRGECVCVSPEAMAETLDEAVLRTGVRDRIWFTDLLLTAKPFTVSVSCLELLRRGQSAASPLSGLGFRLEMLKGFQPSKRQGQSCHTVNGSVPPASIRSGPLSGRLHRARSLAQRGQCELGTHRCRWGGKK